MDVSGLFSDDKDGSVSQSAGVVRDGHQDRPTHLQAVSAPAAVESDPDPMRLLRRIAAESGAGESPEAVVEDDDNGESVDAAAMSPVQRIQAMRDGRLAFPDIGGGENGDGHSGTDDSSGDGGERSADEASGGQASEGGLSDFTDGLSAGAVSGRDRVLSVAKSVRSGAKRKPILAAVGAVTVAGLVLYAFGVGRGGDEDNSSTDDGQSQSSVSSSSAQSSAPVSPIIDGPIIPVSADASPDVCGAGSTPGMDGFSRSKDTAWFCNNPFGFVPGTKLAITLPSMTALTKVCAVPGFDGKGEDRKDNWSRYPLVKVAMWYFDGVAPQRQEFTPDRKSQCMTVGTPEQPVYTRAIQLVILETKPPTAAGGGSGSSQASTATSAPKGNGGLFGDLGQWGERLGGGGAAPAAGGGAEAPAASSFAMSNIVLTGHAAR